MSDIRLNKKFIDRVLNPAIKITTSALFFKDDSNENVVMTTHDNIGACKVSISTGVDNIHFEQDELGILDLTDVNKYLKLTGYPFEEDSYVRRVESKTVRGNTMDCLEIKGPIGKFTVPTAHIDNFDDRPHREILVDRDDTSDKAMKKILTFSLPVDELSDIYSIGSSLIVEKVTLAPFEEGIKLYLKGKGVNQYTKIIPKDTITYHSYESEDGDTVDYFTDPDSMDLLPFAFQIFMHAKAFDDNFTFDLVRKGPVYALKAFGGTDNSIQDGDSSNVIYKMITTLNPNNEVGGNYVDVFDIQ